MSYDKRTYAHGTSLTVEYPWGMFRSGRAMCSDGTVRALKRIALTADTFFSVPASVTVNGRTVSGYVSVECVSGSSVETEDDPPMVKFCAYAYGKNADALPDGLWRRNEALERGYDMARESYGDDYADYLRRTDEEHAAKGYAPVPWPRSLQGNDGI